MAFYVGIISLGFILISILSLWQRHRLSNYTEAILLIFALICYDGILYVFVKALKSLSTSEAFFLGYGFAFLHLLFHSRFINLWNLLKIDIALFISRTLIISQLLSFEFKTTGFIAHAIINLLFLSHAFHLQTGQEKLVFNLFQLKEQSVKTRERIFNYMPNGLLVVAGNSKKQLYSNQVFDKVASCVLQNTEETPQLKKDSEMPSCLEKFIIEKNSWSKRFVQDFFTKRFSFVERPPNLSTVLHDLIKYELVKDDPIQVTVSHVDLVGNKRTYEIKIFRIFWNSEESFMVMFNDITDREAAVYLRLTDANKDKIISTVSHEFRTPLNGILGILQIMEKNSSDYEQTKYISMCKSNASLLLSVANTMLDIQQIREGKFKLYPDRIHVFHMLEEVKSLFDFQCSSKDIYLNIKIKDTVPKYINTDINRLKQVLINLVGNALKFTFEGGITIDVADDDANEDCLRFSIIDTGLGIDDEDKQKLFKDFGKLEKTENVNKGGAGLGLVISDTLTRLLNVASEDKGIKVDSQVGKGSKFYFIISKSLRRPSENAASLESDDQHISNESLRSVEEKLHTHSLSLRRSSFVPSIKCSNIIQDADNTFLDSPKKLLSVSNVFLDAEQQTTYHSRTDSRSKSGMWGATNKRSSFFKQKIEYSPRNTFPLALIVDDNPFNLLVAQNLVQSSGFRVKTAFNGKSAIEMVRKHSDIGLPFKLILMDCEMPVMDGYETTRILTKSMMDNEIPPTSIIALTAHEKTEEKRKCQESGMLDVLVKPINEKKLMKVLEKYK